LGGHDHSSVCEKIGRVTLIKSGSDFEEFSDITVNQETNEVDRKKIMITDAFAPDLEICKHVDTYAKSLNEKLKATCAYFDVELDGRF
jgi:hypothetical protein